MYKGGGEEEAEEKEEELSLVRSSNCKNGYVDLNEDLILVASLKNCTQKKDLHGGRRIHVDIVQKGLLDTNTFIGNSLVYLYGKCGALSKAQEVLDELHARNVVSWNALIAGYAQHGHIEYAIYCFERMQLEGIPPNGVTFLSTLKACASAGALDEGQVLHARIIEKGILETDIVLANSLTDMYSKCGLGGKAQVVFDNLLVQDVVSWNALINGLAQDGHDKEVLQCFELMQHQGVPPDAITVVCVLKACCNLEASCRGQEIHARIASLHGLLENNSIVACALIDMYAKCGLLGKAQDVFDKLTTRVVVLWNALIAGYTQHEHFEEALRCFAQMKHDGCLPDGVTFLCVLKACGSMGAANKGIETHAEIARERLWDTNTAIANALIDMYAKCGLVGNAQEVFDKLHSRNVVSWNALIGGFSQENDSHSQKALVLFEQMRCEGFSPDIVTFIGVLKACGNLKASQEGQAIHSEIVKVGASEDDSVVSNALVDLYANCGMLGDAREVFNKILVRDVASWNSLILGLVHHNHSEEALELFNCMQVEGFLPNSVTFLGTLKACDDVRAAQKGQHLHSEIVKRGLLGNDMVIGTALVGMYAGSGMLREAQDVFDKLPTQDLFLWNVLIAGYAQLGQGDMAFDVLHKMIKEDASPDVATWTILLNACIHTGLVGLGQMYFEIMRTQYDIVPNLEHHNCMVDLFARAGQLDQAVSVIGEMPFCASGRVWHVVLGASQRCNDINFGRRAFAHAAALNEVDASVYVFLSNILAHFDN